jgi:alkylation response protein AidB-like acyl-CoA dehydrogenase
VHGRDRVAGLRDEVVTFLSSGWRAVDPQVDDPPALIAPDHDIGNAIEAARAFQRRLHAAGLAGLTVPREHGGQGLPEEADAIWADVVSAYAIPNMTPLAVGLTLAVDTLLACGSAELVARHVAATLAADQVWCQLFSEPDAGSDLASLRTRADAVADGSFEVTGAKVWTSFASHADFALLLSRTDVSSRAHAGLTMFVLDMSTPGVEVRPLREMTGGAHFNEVRLDGVRVPADCVIGAVGDGWRVAMSTLGSERGRVRQRGRPRWQRVAAAAIRGAGDEIARDEIARLAIDETVAQWTADRAGASASLQKLAAARVEQRAAALAVGLRGAAATAWEGDAAADARLVHWFLGSRANSIAGGTDQIQQNIIAERVLGLPRDPRAAG